MCASLGAAIGHAAGSNTAAVGEMGDFSSMSSVIHVLVCMCRFCVPQSPDYVDVVLAGCKGEKGKNKVTSNAELPTYVGKK